MRFRAKLLDITCIDHLSRVVSTLARSVKACVLRLSSDKVCFVISGGRGPVGGANIWCELSQSNVFDEYRIEGKDESNEIYLELNIEQLSRALKSALTAQVLKIKLTKKQGPCLTLEILLPTMTGAHRTVVHDIPVAVVPVRLWPDYQEPDMPEIDVSIYLPPLKLLKNIVDRMKTMSNFVTISANMNGELNIKLQTDSVTVTTYFKDLQNHHFQDTSMSESRDNDLTMCEARVDIRKFSQFVQGQFVPTKVICNVIDGRGLQIFLLHEDVSLQYYIPAVST
ncbi:checkpoint protein HUS1-like [Halichondria panicea]|uniref:checkpoint protein HUS1-like n=1 Tax=Halichondria panicea TaxID=6063 RepID=UPI00312B2B7F